MARVGVIGAGCSGITAIKNLLQAGITDVVCYEKSNEIGVVNSNGVLGLCRKLKYKKEK